MKLVSINAHLSNADKADRSYAIEGSVRIDSNTVSVESGTVTASDGSYLGNFSEYGDNLNITYQTAADRSAILAAVESFVNGAKEYAAENYQI